VLLKLKTDRCQSKKSRRHFVEFAAIGFLCYTPTTEARVRGSNIVPKRKSVVALNPSADALTIFVNELTPGIQDIRGEFVRIDIGDYAHAILGDEDKETRIRWIRETLQNPQEIRASHLPSKPDRENYINTIYESDQDAMGTSFVVGVRRQLGKLDFRTAVIPTEAYLRNLRNGKLLWRP
jgi:hypothetical protein